MTHHVLRRGRHGHKGKTERCGSDRAFHRHLRQQRANKTSIVLEKFVRTSSFQQVSHSIASTLSSGRNTMTLAGSVRPIVAALTALTATAMIARAQDANDYPTAARAEYVFG